MPAERLFGVETEYAFVALRPDGSSLGPATVASFMETARKQLAHVPALHCSGIFLPNGGLLYQDCGMHPEFATPECTNPWDVVRYIRAGDEILAGVARSCADAQPRGSRILLFKSNVDYSGSHATWGCHESYGYRTSPPTLYRRIIPHLVSRVVYTGAGGFNPLSKGLEFTLSPRAWHLGRESSGNSTADRGIVHTKDEPLAEEGYHRLHLLCGESLRSDVAVWLKLGATALVVALIEAGHACSDTVAPRAPLPALHAFARDSQCTKRVQTVGGERLSALQIQRYFLAEAEAHLHEEFMPAWAGEVCRVWREMLERLEAAPGSAARSLDWAIKHELYSVRARRRGFAWESLPVWTEIVDRLLTALKNSAHAGKGATVEFVLGEQSPIPEEVVRVRAFARRHGLSLAQLRPFVDLRKELLEIDTRWGQLGEDGLFAALERSGLLSHQVPDLGSIEAAMTEPPTSGRARVRGSFIRRAARKPGRYRCGWADAFDLLRRRRLNLADPFETREKWSSATDGPPLQDAGLDRFRALLAAARARVSG
jgi:proteasome accessory factor A